jgi:hypothetical protein
MRPAFRLSNPADIRSQLLIVRLARWFILMQRNSLRFGSLFVRCGRFCCNAKFSRHRRIADIEQATPINLAEATD